MARALSIEEYGILATLFSINYVLAIFMESIQIIITKYSAEEEEKGKQKNIFKRSLRKAVFLSLLVFVAYSIVSVPLSSLFNISLDLMILNGLMIFFIFFIPISRGVLQGTKRFKALGMNMITESAFKILIAIGFIYLGFRVYGAILGAILGVFVAYLVSVVNLREILLSHEKKAEVKDIRAYSKPSFYIILIIFAFYNIDIVMAKMLFSGETAGSYAIASMLGKMIFLFTQPISRAMFPLSAESESKKKKSSELFSNSLVFISLIIAASLIIFYFFPELLVKIFSGKAIELSSSILFYLAIAFSVLSFANLKLLYNLSVNKIRGYQYLMIFLVLEIIILIIFSRNLLEYSLAFIASSLIFLIGSIIILKKQ